MDFFAAPFETPSIGESYSLNNDFNRPSSHIWADDELSSMFSLDGDMDLLAIEENVCIRRILHG